MAVVGGLVLSMSANFAKDNDPIRPQVLFHIGRLASFFILGGTIGTIGSMVQFGVYTTIVLNFVVAGILLILGINLLDILPWAKKFQLSLPSSVGKKVHAVKSINHTLTPLLVGVVTFFLPCGFTQSMQLYTLTTGSFLTGSLTMLVFALGTLPVLSLLSFSSLSIHDHKHKGIFFKAVGIIVVFFGVFNLINALVLSGAIQPLFNF
jgi:sulfite exporter TauE/SafE